MAIPGSWRSRSRLSRILFAVNCAGVVLLGYQFGNSQLVTLGLMDQLMGRLQELIKLKGKSRTSNQ